MRIYIPTLGRIGRQHTYDALPGDCDKVLVVSANEHKAHGARQTIVCPVKGIHRVRQWILENATEKFAMVDDDLAFFVRGPMRDELQATPFSLYDANENHLRISLRQIESELNHFAHVAIDAREGSNRHFYLFVDNSRALRFLCYRKSVLMRHKIRFDAIPLMEDFHTTLSLMEAGFTNRILCDVCHDQTGGSGADGGCSTYRDEALQKQAAHRLKELHPSYVTVVEKTSKNWKGFGATRTDVRIAWKKAYDEAVAITGPRKP